MGGGRGKWSGNAKCPSCGRMISKRGFAWAAHEKTHPELLEAKRKAKMVWRHVLKLAGIKE